MKMASGNPDTCLGKKIDRLGFTWALSGEDSAYLFHQEKREETKVVKTQNSSTDASAVRAQKGLLKSVVDSATQA